MAKQSAGLLMYRTRGCVEVFLVHPGGPFWARKDQGAWSIPKGEFTAEEDSDFNIRVYGYNLEQETTYSIEVTLP